MKNHELRGNKNLNSCLQFIYEFMENHEFIYEFMENHEFIYEFMKKTYEFWWVKKGFVAKFLYMNSYMNSYSHM